MLLRVAFAIGTMCVSLSVAAKSRGAARQALRIRSALIGDVIAALNELVLDDETVEIDAVLSSVVNVLGDASQGAREFLRRLFIVFDASGDGRATLDEALAVCSQLGDRSDAEAIGKRVYDVFDFDGSGTVEAAELVKYIAAVLALRDGENSLLERHKNEAQMLSEAQRIAAGMCGSVPGSRDAAGVDRFVAWYAAQLGTDAPSPSRACDGSAAARGEEGGATDAGIELPALALPETLNAFIALSSKMVMHPGGADELNAATYAFAVGPVVELTQRVVCDMVEGRAFDLKERFVTCFERISEQSDLWVAPFVNGTGNSAAVRHLVDACGEMWRYGLTPGSVTELSIYTAPDRGALALGGPKLLLRHQGLLAVSYVERGVAGATFLRLASTVVKTKAAYRGAAEIAKTHFDALDLNHDGHVTMAEFVKYMRKQGLEAHERSAAGKNAMALIIAEFQAMDDDGDRRLSLGEITAHLDRQSARSAAEPLHPDQADQQQWVLAETSEGKRVLAQREHLGHWVARNASDRSLNVLARPGAATAGAGGSAAVVRTILPGESFTVTSQLSRTVHGRPVIFLEVNVAAASATTAQPLSSGGVDALPLAPPRSGWVLDRDPLSQHFAVEIVEQRGAWTYRCVADAPVGVRRSPAYAMPATPTAHDAVTKPRILRGEIVSVARRAHAVHCGRAVLLLGLAKCRFTELDASNDVLSFATRGVDCWVPERMPTDAPELGSIVLFEETSKVAVQELGEVDVAARDAVAARIAAAADAEVERRAAVQAALDATEAERVAYENARVERIEEAARKQAAAELRAFAAREANLPAALDDRPSSPSRG